MNPEGKTNIQAYVTKDVRDQFAKYCDEMDIKVSKASAMLIIKELEEQRLKEFFIGRKF